MIAAFAILLGGSGAGGARAQGPEIPPIVGETPRPDQIRPIDDPGTVGLGPGYPGSLYAIVAGHLVRIDAASGRIQSILRPLPALPAPPD